ncbi:hypothetical protein [Larkinella punicea]|uniref:Uncharacterized protein n=1 Tax=Larkinella punicea TaxID=2315727 RepID=A0A368JTM8_9BACT|nr:hypothetical protein [Larkinella punicea]RCR70685.1 hypothetical protein DUE52_03570 [Larkinella punicea]
MKTIAYVVLLMTALVISDACQTKDPIPLAPAGAVAVAKVNAAKAYFDVTNLATTDFEFQLSGEDFGQGVGVKAIEVWIGLNSPKITLAASMTSCGNGVGCLYPSGSLAPLPSRLVANDKLWKTFSTFPATVSIKASEAAAAVGVSPTSLVLNDTFQLKFVVQTNDGRRFDAFHDGICDETRGQVGDCRLVIRVDNKKSLYQPLK